MLPLRTAVAATGLLGCRVVELPVPGGRQFGQRRSKRAFEATRLQALPDVRASSAAAQHEAQAGLPAEDDLIFVLLERNPV